MRDMPKNTFKTERKSWDQNWDATRFFKWPYTQSERGAGPKLAVTLGMKASCTAARTTLQ